MEGKIIRTHQKAWGIEKQVHMVGDFKLPIPLTLDSLGFALLGVVIASLICRIPFIGAKIPVLIYGLCVVGLPYGMRKLRIHSKTPSRFIIDYVLYLGQPKSMARFQPVHPQGPIRFTNVNFKR